MLLAQGCAFYERHKKAIIGAGIGAAAGAAVGGLAKGRKGALVGGLVGALAGGAIGAYLDHKDKTAAQTNQAHNYDPNQGVRVELVAVTADPNTVAPGGKVHLQATYAVMAPNPQQEIAVTETRLVTLGGAKVADPTTTVNRLPGTYTSQVPITLPTDATKGRYDLAVTVAAAGKQSQLTSAFVVN
jgi:hypothetical protein